MRTGEYYSSGKLLLTGEYVVLQGARALAVPLKVGQRMKVSAGINPGILEWNANVLGDPWFQASYRLPDLQLNATSHTDRAEFLRQVLVSGSSMSAADLTARDSLIIQTDLEFDINWGLGSSSSLISNLAYWLDIDPFKLFRENFPGSGYDVFCARAKKPILYQLQNGVPLVTEIDFNPPFKDSLYLVYLGSKQDSQASVSKFKSTSVTAPSILEEISGLTDRFVDSKDIREFSEVIRLHEERMSGILGIPPIGRSRFPDFHGDIKSLGAWGGDFILAASLESYEKVREYFFARGLKVIFRYPELVAEF